MLSHLVYQGSLARWSLRYHQLDILWMWKCVHCLLIMTLFPGLLISSGTEDIDLQWDRNKNIMSCGIFQLRQAGRAESFALMIAPKLDTCSSHCSLARAHDVIKAYIRRNIWWQLVFLKYFYNIFYHAKERTLR